MKSVFHSVSVIVGADVLGWLQYYDDYLSVREVDMNRFYYLKLVFIFPYDLRLSIFS